MIRPFASTVILAIALVARTVRAQAPSPDAPAPPTPGAPAPQPAPAPAPPPEPAPAPSVPTPSTEEPPRILQQQAPIFPDVPKDQQKATDVLVHVEVDASGSPSNPRVISPANAAFDDLATSCVLMWTFDPARKDGQPVASHLTVTVHFDPAAPAPSETISITGNVSKLVKGHATAPSVGAADHRTTIDHAAAAVPHPAGAVGYLNVAAPGFLLTNEGGEGHAEQIFLRGFDAREGQDIEMRVNGDVVNQVGNLHGNGYADLHFVIPELVEALRVVEGPYDPRQGNFAVAGSAEYELGLERRGLYAHYELGSFGTQRALLLWGPPNEDTHTFGGVEVYQTNGFGQNRDARRATAMGQVEGKLGEQGIWRLTGGLYTTDYHSAGVIREDDYDAGRIGFYDTYDSGQGGDASRAFVLGDVETTHDDVTYHDQLSLTTQTMGLREDFTGFLLDQQTPLQQPHGQRGDLISLESDDTTAQTQGWARQHHAIGGLSQDLEVGYFARLDLTSGQQYRIEAATGHPYHKDVDLDATLGDVGLYAAIDAQLQSWLALRAGVRDDLLTYSVLDNCAVQSVAHPSKQNPPGDASCLSQGDFGSYREPVQRSTASGEALLPRASLVFGPWARLSPSLSYGTGVRSIDPTYVTNDEKTPFASIASYDAGLSYLPDPDADVRTSVKLSAFRTHVDQDLVFSETAGRNVLAGATTRKGASLSGRVTGAWFDEIASATLVQSTFDDTGLLIPYVPDVVVRSDSAIYGAIPYAEIGDQRVQGIAALGVTYVGPRALPYGERSDTIFTIDGSAHATWDRYTLGVEASNLLDTKYRLGEYNYASDFHGEAEPTLTIARHFTAGAPRTVIFLLEVKL